MVFEKKNVLDCLESTGQEKQQHSGLFRFLLESDFIFVCRMITGDEVMTTGESFIGNVSLSSQKSTYLQSIGYCPQFDSIIEVCKSLLLIK